MRFRSGTICALLFCLGLMLGWPHALRGASATTQNAGQTQPTNEPATQPNAQTTPQSQGPPGATPPTNSSASVNGTPGFWTQNFLTGDWDGFRDDLNKHGVSFTPTLTAEVFGNPSGGARQGVISDGLFNLTLDLDLDPMTGGAVKDLVIHANAFYIYGTNLSQQYVRDFSTTSNIAAYNTLRLDELWLQKAFWDKKITLKVGNMAVDTEFFQSASASLFISGTFGAFTFIANNVPDAPVYPLASPGIRLQLLPDPHFYVMAGVYGLANNPNPEVNDKDGVRFPFDDDSGVLVMSEAGFLLNQAPNEKGLQGAYRLGSFLDTGNFDTFESKSAFAKGTGPLQSAGADYGIYGVVDQQIYTKSSQIVSIFTRVGGAPTNTNFVNYYVDGGFNFTGFVPGRDKDVAGIGVARSHVSGDYSESQVALGDAPLSAETVIEGTYKIQFSPWWNVQPDVQYIVTPSGVEGSRDALVLGVRTNVAF